MLFKINKKITPVILKLRRPGQILLTPINHSLFPVPSSLFLPRHHIPPRAHRITGNIRTQTALAAKLNIFIKKSIIKFPRAVRFLHATYHRVIAIKTLIIPRKVKKRHSKCLAAALGKCTPNTLHLRVMFLGERLYIKETRNRPRMLPEIKEILPVFCRRKITVNNRQDELIGLTTLFAKLDDALSGLRFRSDSELNHRRLRFITLFPFAADI